MYLGLECVYGLDAGFRAIAVMYFGYLSDDYTTPNTTHLCETNTVEPLYNTVHYRRY